MCDEQGKQIWGCEINFIVNCNEDFAISTVNKTKFPIMCTLFFEKLSKYIQIFENRSENILEKWKNRNENITF